MTALSAGLLISLPAYGQALPGGGQVVAGQGRIGTPQGGALAIDQASQRLAIDWQQFNIGAGHIVQFNQPGRDAVALNRVLGPDASQIMGQLQANGRVFLVNPNGVLFGQSARVDVGGLVASTLNINNADFMAGNYRFQGNGSPASVVNQGRISAGDGGAVALLGGQVRNQGVIQARMGTVALAAGNAVTLDFAGDGLLNVQVDQAAKNALADNGQLIQADGGQVLMTASASDALLQTVVNNTGVIEARTLENREGQIVLLGDFAGGTVKVDGRLDASAPNSGDGGFIDTSGAYVQVADGVEVTTFAPQGRTGTWLIDPTDFTVYAGTGGSDEPGSSGIGAETLSSMLDAGNGTGTNVQIATAPAGTVEPGDIHVNAPVSWSADNSTLTLVAHRNININADITATGAESGLKMHYGGHPGPDTPAPGTGYYLNNGAKITLSGSNAIFKVNDVVYTVIQDLAALQGMNPGLAGHYVLGTDIDAGATSDWIDAGGRGFVPIGQDSSRFTGVFDGLGHTVNDLFINRPTTDYVGMFGSVENATIRNVGLVNASVTGDSNVGGLAGTVYGGSRIENSYASGTVTGMSSVIGGLAGWVDASSSLVDSYATAAVNGDEMVGGLAGQSLGSIQNSYATGAVTGDSSVGGLVGGSWGSIQNSYATGAVSGDDSAGGLVGSHAGGAVTDSYWDQDTTGQDASAGGGTGMSTADLQGELPDGFDPAIWGVVEGSYPYLLNQFAAGAAPQVVAGTVSSDCGCDPVSGIAVGGWHDGAKLVSAQTGGDVYTGANGYYYYLLAPDTLSPDTPLLMYADGEQGGEPVQGALLGDGPDADWQQMDLFNGLFEVRTASLDAWSSVLDVLEGSEAETMALNLPDLAIAADGAFTLDSELDRDGFIAVQAAGKVSVGEEGGLTAGGPISLIGGDIAVNADVKSTGEGSAILLAACSDCGGGDIDIDGAVSVEGLDGSIVMMTDGSISVREAVTARGDWAEIALLGQDISVQSGGSLHADGDNAVIALAACGSGCGPLDTDDLDIDDADIDGMTPGSDLDPGFGLSMEGAIALDGDVSIEGDGGMIAMAGGLISHGTDADDTKIEIVGDNGLIALAACTEDNCGDILINNEVSIIGDDGAVFMVADDGIYSTGDISIEGDNGVIALLGGEVELSDESTISVSGDGGFIAVAACGDAGCRGQVDDVEGYEGADPASILPTGGRLSADGAIFADGDASSIVLVGGDVDLDADVSVQGDAGGIALVADRLSINGDVGISGYAGVVYASTEESLASSGAISVTGKAGQIMLEGPSLVVDGEVTLNSGEATTDGYGGEIFIYGSQVAVNNAVTLNGEGFLAIHGSQVEITDTVTLTGDEGQITIDACGCGLDGDLAIYADVAATGADGAIDLFASGNLLLDADLSAAAVFMQGERGLLSTSSSVITAYQLDARSERGAVNLAESTHRVELMQGSAATGLWFANGIDLALGQAQVTGEGDIGISTGGDLTLVEGFDPFGDPVPAAGTVSVKGQGDIDLAAGGAFTNTLGADAVQADQGNWRIWSRTPSDDHLAGLAYDYKQYNAHYGSSSVLGQGNGVLYTLAPVLDVAVQGPIAKTYDGTARAEVADADLVLRGLVGGDQAVLARGQAHYSDPNAGEGKTVTVDGLRVAEAYEADGTRVYGYRVQDTASAEVGRIDRRAITVAADDQHKRLGQADPALTWRITEGGLVAGDGLSGALVRDSGELPGRYAIRQGSLAAGGNYAMAFVGGELLVSMATIDDDLGDLAAAYHGAVFSAKNTPRGPMAFDQDTGEGGSQPSALYHIENDGLRMPEGI